MTSRNLPLGAVAYALALAYLSFLPFELRPLTFPQAVTSFEAIQLLRIGPENRADWVANILLYIPLGFLAAAALGRGRSSLGIARVGAALTAFGLCAAWAVAVEFGQVFFAPRTVSVNDIAAEWIGSVFGALVWLFAGGRAHEWWERLRRGGHLTARAALAGYGIAYVGVSLFPFDFVTTLPEFAARLEIMPPAWWFAGGACEGAGCWFRFLVDAVAVAPLGWWLSAWLAPTRLPPASALLAGAALGLLVEGGQLFILSGISQGASIAARGVGMLAGVLLFERRSVLARFDFARYGRGLVLLGVLPYLLAVGVVNGWLSSRWMPFDMGVRRVEEVSFLPFFYHYFTTETAAFRSLLVHAALYVPVGVACWLWAAGRRKPKAGVAAITAAVLAGIAELGKLFLEGRRPDPTDALVAAAAAWATVRLLNAATTPVAVASVEQRLPGADPVTGARVVVEAADRPAGRSLASMTVGAALLVVAGWSILSFPVWRGFLVVTVLAYALAVFRWPNVYLLVLPAVLPVLDLAPWSGRFYWDELDILLTATIGVLLTSGKLGAPRALARGSVVAMSLYAAWAVVAAAIAVLPLAPIDANSFASYLSSYGAVRQLKPALWAVALLWLMRRSARDATSPTDWLFAGLALGNLTASISVVWERAATVGVLDLVSEYRVSGLTSAMHTGGAYIDGFLVLSLPFVLLQFNNARRVSLKAFWALVAAMGVYAVFVTFSRGALLGLAVAALVWTGALAIRGAREAAVGRPRKVPLVQFAAGVAFVIGLAAIAIGAPYMRERMAASSAVLDERLAHWSGAWEVMGGGVAPMLTGVGTGRFPAVYFWASTRGAAVPPSYRIAPGSEPNGPVLQLGGGAGLYVEQRLFLDPDAVYTASFRARGMGEEPRLDVALCKKGIVQSLGCSQVSFRLSGEWQWYTAELGDPEFPRGAMLFPMTVLSVSNPAMGSVVELDDVSLRVSGGSDQVGNGGFGSGMDRWFMASDDHLAWHAKNLYLHLVVESGLVGLAAFLVLLGRAGALAARSLREDAAAAITLSAFAGFLAVGLGDTLVDSPRLLLALLLVVVGALHRFNSAASQRR